MKTKEVFVSNDLENWVLSHQDCGNDIVIEPKDRYSTTHNYYRAVIRDENGVVEEIWKGPSILD